ncbi:S-adenosyl-L-methionine-dependent tRNA 4-demethylwyosine synthase [Astathelohania contejeani]|uniref:tRNA 4-demethylwyosine synthase (AdoMet-dependent) n=1 Tax=Astathelohania contejeani TaxID=164912 RepID=A0ABQ7HX19_9MICR|nr:S-adenosyl-L-methionine-dependent tRNA 4-demethylwyosine synthase [Thelohania contejeani]
MPLFEQEIKILYGTETNTALKYASKLVDILTSNGIKCTYNCISEYNVDDLSTEKGILIILISTFFDGKPPKKAEWFCAYIDELEKDFRVERNYLSHLKYALFGLGSRAYKEDFNLVARNLSKAFKSLSATPLIKTGYGDEYNDQESYFLQWANNLLINLKNDKILIEEDEIIDLEEIITPDDGEMLNATLKKNLTKQGYHIIGSHSGVKMCRWTKSMLRGNGGCYKHTFYGIESHRCMEATSSLACANKCVFCWRHYTNPVGTEWKWKTDDPERIVEECLKEHRKMVYQMKTAPGVSNLRYDEGLDVKHCALSLVGEPIMYPRINDLINKFHERNISTFLVTNAQFVEQLRLLKPVTQLYLSIDGANKETLKNIDRPLFKDYWERFISCVKLLKKRKERTVFRLTLVKGQNNDDVEGYANLVQIGSPDFIEIKGVTFCGYDKTSPMSMKNVPFFDEVIYFSKELIKKIISGDGDYEIACEHGHSCSVLIAKKKFKVEGRWKTWIDFKKFNEIIQSNEDFDSLSYSTYTPDWAVFGAPECGFDPAEIKTQRKKNSNK